MLQNNEKTASWLLPNLRVVLHDLPQKLKNPQAKPKLEFTDSIGDYFIAALRKRTAFPLKPV